MTGIANRIMRRARAQTAHGTRSVFTPKDFLDFGSRDAVDQALSRLVKQGDLRRISRGLFDIPRVNAALKRPAAPDVDAVVDAIARRDDVAIVPTGMAAANRLGLTTAVSAKNAYLTDGRSRAFKIGNRTITLKHAGRKLMAIKSGPAGDAVRALHWLGPDMARDDHVVATLRRKLPDSAKRDLARAKPKLDRWTAQVADRILAPA